MYLKVLISSSIYASLNECCRYRKQHGMDKLPAQSAPAEASTASSTPQNTSESQLVGVESGLEPSGTRHTSLEDFHLPLSLTDNVYADHCAIYVKTEKDYGDYPGSATMDDVERRNRDMMMAYGIPGTSRYYDESMESNSDCGEYYSMKSWAHPLLCVMHNPWPTVNIDNPRSVHVI